MPQLINVTDSIWCFRQPSYFACSYIVKTPSGIVLVDSGMNSDAEALLAAVVSLGGRPTSVSTLLLTHWHNDHAAGASTVRDRTGAVVHYHEREAPFFDRSAARGGVLGALADRVPEVGPLVLLKGLLGNSVPTPVPATSYAQAGNLLADEFEVIETPGHTPGHLSYVYRPEKVLFAGDALAVVGGELRYMARPVTPDRVAARASMQRCLDRELRIICPGHREPLLRDVEPQRRKLLDRLKTDERWPLFG
jgi:glyoxylase-like metal-dependent hydrolase (beta-lactamase superfamily II)